MGITGGGNIHHKVSDIAALKLQNIRAAGSVNSASFAEILQKTQKTVQKEEGIKFSKHAAIRIEQRGIAMGDGFIEQLKSAIDKADEKGARNVAIISQRGAFIVNVPNRTVVTGMTEQEMKNNIFTNIDAAITL